jgi:hypothetical protein
MTEGEHQRPVLEAKNMALSVDTDVSDFTLLAAPDQTVSRTEFHDDLTTALRTQI